jgi:probable F420-dependent oxidoreductase
MSGPGSERTPLVCVRPPGWLHERADGVFSGLREWVQKAEALGFDGVFVGDRMMSSARAAGGSVYGASMLEATTTLAALAACTERVLLGPLVLVLPFRQPIPMAKTLGTLDVLSNGRLVLGAGVGWNGPELKALGIDPRERGRRFEESLEIMRELWTGEPVTHEGRFWSFEDVQIHPVPVRPGGPPVWIASFAPDQALDWIDAPPASSLRVLDRIGRLADGWVPLVYSASAKRRLEPRVLGAAWDHVLESAAKVGRGRADIDLVFSDWGFVIENQADAERCREGLAGFFSGDWDDAVRTYTIGSHEEVLERLRRDTAHVDRVDAWIFTPLSDDPRQLELLAEHVAPALRRGL